MSAIDVSAIRLALRKILLDATSEKIERSAFLWENEGKAQSALGLQIRESMELFYEHSAFQLLNSAGRWILEVTVPVGSGTEQQAAAVKAIVDAFEPVYASASVDSLYIERAERGSGYAVGDRYAIPVSILWRAYSQRSALVTK